MSKRKLIYLAHPVSPYGDRTLEMNLQQAEAWLRWAILTKDVYAIAPYIGMCYALDEDDPQHRLKGLEIDMEVLGRCDELWLCGEKITEGMKVERSYAGSCGIDSRDFTGERWPI